MLLQHELLVKSYLVYIQVQHERQIRRVLNVALVYELC